VQVKCAFHVLSWRSIQLREMDISLHVPDVGHICVQAREMQHCDSSSAYLGLSWQQGQCGAHCCSSAAFEVCCAACRAAGQSPGC